MAKAKPPTIFVSYSHKDQDWLDYLKSHLGPALRAGSLDLWDDTRLRGGDDWEAEIEKAMRACKVCILLVSRHSLTSDYIDRVEMKTILERVAKDDVRIYPVFVSPVHVAKKHWLRKFNWRPRDGEPLVRFSDANGDRDAATVSIVDELVSVLNEKTPPKRKAKTADAQTAPSAATAVTAVGGSATSKSSAQPAPRGRGGTAPASTKPFHDYQSFGRWLDDQPSAVAMVLAVRTALRVAPFLGDLRSRQRGRSALLLPLLRGMAASWVAAKYPTHRAAIAAYADAADAADAARAEAADAARAASARAAADDYAAFVATAYVVRAAHAAYAARADAAAYAAGVATYATAIWNELATDASAFETGSSVSSLLDRPLWSGGEPTEIAGKRREFVGTLARGGEGWEYWLQWLDDRFAGRPADEEKEVARLTLPEELWTRGTKNIEGVKAVNAEIARRLAEIDERRALEAADARKAPTKPALPSPETGTDYRIGNEGLQTRPGPRVVDPATRLERLHARLAREVADLVTLSKKVGNSHPQLLRVVAEYAECFASGFDQLELDLLWDTGLGLVEMASVFERDGIPADERLSAEHMGLLNIVAAQHASLVHAIPELGARAVAAGNMRARMSVLSTVARPMATVLERFAEAERGVESKTREFLKVVAIGFEATGGDHYEAAHSAYTNVTNILIRVGEHLDRIDEATPEGAKGVLEAVVDGDPENTRALVRIFGEIEPEIRAFAAAFPALKSWIDWIYLRLDRLKRL